jgi:hypothetical protein
MKKNYFSSQYINILETYRIADNARRQHADVVTADGKNQ